MFCVASRLDAHAFDLTLLQESRYLGPQLQIFEDFSDTCSLETIAAMDSTAFIKAPAQIPLLHYTSNSIWTRVALYSDVPREVFLEIVTPLMDEVRVYVLHGSGVIDSFATGIRVPTVERPFLHWNYVFPLSFVGGDSTMLIARFRNSGQVELALRAWDGRAFYQYNHRSMMMVGFFYGLMLGVSLLVFLSFKTFQDSIYLYYFATIASFFLFLSSSNGIGLRFLAPDWFGVFLPHVSILSTQLLLLSLLEFTRKFLDTRTLMPRVDRMLSWTSMTVAFTLLLGFLLEASVIGAMLPYLSLVVLLLVTLAVLRRRQRDWQVTYYVLGMIVPLGIGFLYALQFLLPIPDRMITIEDFYWGFLFVVVFIGFGLGKRLHALQQETMLLQRQSVENLQKADQLKDEFLANTSHELRTPLNGIIGIAESLLGGYREGLPIKAQRSMKLIVSCGHRLLNLINDILDYSLLKNGEIKLKIHPVQVRQSTGIVLSILSPLAKKKGLDLTNQVSLDCPLVLADEDRLQQILLNLVGNAIKFTDHGSIKVSAQRVDKELLVRVVDTGVGIAPESHDRIFEMFHQVDSSDARSQGGTGIGLSLTRKLVHLLGGQIWVESSQGQGSQFQFTLPLANKGESVTTSAESAVEFVDAEIHLELEAMGSEDYLESNAPVILLVDDEPINLQVLVNQLSIEGYVLKVATNGKEALEIIHREGPPSLLLLDLMMPGMTGFDVCIQLRQEFDASKLPIIILTAKNQMQDLVKGLEIGANDFLTKPFTRPELLARVRVHLALMNLHKAYTRFVPQEFLKQMQRENFAEVQLGDQLEQYLAVLVADIRDFTALSERVAPAETFAFLNGYLGRVAPVIREHGGFVSKFLGDAIIALFPDGARQALAAGQAMLNELELYNESPTGEPVRIGVGVHVGKAILGTVGYQSRMDVTVVSQRIGQAAILERLTKVFGCRMILSGDVVRLTKLLQPRVRLLGRIPQPGRDPWLEFYEWAGEDDDSQGKLLVATRSRFETGVRLFWEEDREGARECFEHVLELNPGDRAAAAYLEKCRDGSFLDFLNLEWS